VFSWCNALSSFGTNGGGCEYLGSGTCANALNPVALSKCGTMHGSASAAILAACTVGIALISAII
jgi:hypothetical protein